MRLTGGELISFSFRAERPKLAVIYVNKVEDDEDDEDDEDNHDPLDEAMIAQRMRLSEEEVCNLHYKKNTSVMIRVCHSRSRFLSCMYIHDKFMTESR